MSTVGRMWSWRAHSYGGCVSLERARRAARRGDTQLLVRVSAAALNPIDHTMLAGYGRSLLGLLRRWEGRAAEELPLVVGREFTGEVVGGSTLKAGTRVWGVVPPHWPGALQEYVLVDREWVSPAPSTMDDYAASGTLYAGVTACAALRAAGAACGQRIIVVGLGAVGSMAVQLLRAAGCDVTVLAAAAAERRAAELGASRLIDRHDPDVDKLLREAGPFHAVIDCAGVGGSGSDRGWVFSRYVTLTSPLLRHTDERGPWLGLVSAAATGARDSLSALMRVRQSDIAPPASLLPPHVRWAFFRANQADIQLLRKLAERGELVTQVDAVIPWRCAGAELNGARERESRGGARGKIVLDFRDDTEPQENTTHEYKS